MSTLILKTGPTVEPVSLEEAKKQLGVEHDLQEALITRCLKSAREWCENAQERSYCPQTWYLYRDDFPADNGPIKLERPPITAVTSIKYTTSDGVQNTLAPADYVVSLPQAKIMPAYGLTWPTDTLTVIDAVVVEFAAGTAAEVPEKTKQAILLLTSWFYMHRGDETEAPDEDTKRAVKSLLLSDSRGVPFA